MNEQQEKGTDLIIRNHHEIRFSNIDALIPQRFDQDMITHERQRRLVDIVARFRLEMRIDRIG